LKRAFAAIWLISTLALGAEEPIAKLEWSGNLDVKYSLLHSRQDSPIYRIMFYPQQLSSTLSQIRLEPYLNADYATNQVAFHMKTHATVYSDRDSRFDLFELYGGVNPTFSSTITGGKRAFNWGKGYAFNPVGYINPPKDPENPELTQAGVISLAGEYTKSFDSSALQTFSFSMIAVPATTTMNHFGEFHNTDLAAKTYFLLWDTDLDLLAYTSKVNARQVGFDFSRNLFANLEAHGEFSAFDNATRNLVSNGTLGTDTKSGSSYLLGFRYLNTLNTTAIVEYYHNGMGLTENEFGDYRNFLGNVLANGQSSVIQQMGTIVRANFQKPVLMQDYLYLKVTQPEPFNWVYFSPSLFSIINLQDGSFSLAAPLSYKPITNLEVIFWPTLFLGREGSEFGGKQIGQRYEAWLKVFF